MEIIEVLKDYKLEKIINNEDFNNLFFLDLETYQYNELKGKIKPSFYKNMIFSVGISVIYQDKIYCNIYYNFHDFLKLIKKINTDFTFYIHNGLKYDNHFLLWELQYYYKLPLYNLKMSSENEDCQKLSYDIEEIKTDAIFQKRIKSKNNLDLTFKLNTNIFKIEDTFLKTNLSIKTLSKKLNKLGVLLEEEMKTDFNYTKYNIDNDLTDYNAKIYAKQIFKSLDSNEKTYIYNDIIILAKVFRYFIYLFQNFDINKLTLSQNILENYLINDLTRFQLLQKLDFFNSVQNTDYFFNNENFYNYLKKYYKGGLNFYNDKYIAKILDIKGFSIDLNSSFPAIMYSDKVPTFLENYGYNKKIYYNDILNDNYYYLFEISKEDFNKILAKSLSINATKMLIKYYFSKNENIYINSNTFKIIKEIFKINIDSIYVKSFLKYSCYPFAGSELIDKYYFIKQQGKSSKKLKYNNAKDIHVTKMNNTDLFNEEEIYQSKVYLNGIYGIPALRAYFNNFKLIENDYINFENGYKNSERNIIFSIYVTSKALYNLLYPLKFLTNNEIDNKLLYTDTDSLYFSDKSLIKKFPKNLIHSLNIGAYGFDCKDITKFYILNHKKYAYFDNENQKIKIKCGGVPLKSFNVEKYNNFNEFIEKEFHYNKEVINQKSILNKQGTISIYQSKTLLDKGEEYPVLALNYDLSFLDRIKKDIEDKIITDVEYIETNIGTFSFNELYQLPDFKKGTDIRILKYKHWHIKNKLGVK